LRPFSAGFPYNLIGIVSGIRLGKTRLNQAVGQHRCNLKVAWIGCEVVLTGDYTYSHRQM